MCKKKLPLKRNAAHSGKLVKKFPGGQPLTHFRSESNVSSTFPWSSFHIQNALMAEESVVPMNSFCLFLLFSTIDDEMMTKHHALIASHIQRELWFPSSCRFCKRFVLAVVWFHCWLFTSSELCTIVYLRHTRLTQLRDCCRCGCDEEHMSNIVLLRRNADVELILIV